MFTIIHEDIDNKATITTASGLIIIKSIKDFPKGQKFAERRSNLNKATTPNLSKDGVPLDTEHWDHSLTTYPAVRETQPRRLVQILGA
jgi:hypothetical protein